MSFYVPASYALPRIVFNLWRVSALVVSIFSGLSLLVSSNISKRFLVVFAYFFWLYVGTHFTSPHGQINLYQLLMCTGFVAYLEFLLCTRPLKTVMKAYIIAGFVMTLMHFASFVYIELTGNTRLYATVAYSVMYGKEHTSWIENNNRYFLSFDNVSVYYFIPVISLLLYYSVYYNRKAYKYFLAYSAMVLFMFIYKTAATAMVVSIFQVSALVYLYSLRNNRKLIAYPFLKYKSAVTVGVFSEIAPMLLMGGSLAAGISTYFGKGADFGRLLIWTKSFIQIVKRPILGWGIEDSITTINRLNIGRGYGHCHHLVLENLYRGGVVALVLFFMIVSQYRPRRPDKFKTAIFATAIIAYFVTASMDWRYNIYFPLAIFVFCYHTNRHKE